MKYKIGSLIEQVKIKSGNPNHPNVSGINILKQFMPSKNIGADTSKYLVVPHNNFACNLMHVGRDERIPIAINADNNEIVVSAAYFVFQIAKTEIILPEYLNMIFQSEEFDRFAWFCTDASIRGNLEWSRFCDIDIDLPPLEIQKKYVVVYKALLANQKSYENGLEDLRLVCDATVERLRRELPLELLGKYISQINNKNTSLLFGVDAVKGISIEKKFIETKAKIEGVSLKNYLIVAPNEFVYVTVTSRNGGKISLAHNNFNDAIICSSSYVTFRVENTRILNPSYLSMFFRRDEFDRYTRYNSWGSARETFNWEDMQEVKIPIPDIKIQQSIVDIYNAYITRQEINEKLKQQIKDVCPILINGAIKEANLNDEV